MPLGCFTIPWFSVSYVQNLSMRKQTKLNDRDLEYLSILFDRLEVCKHYRPKFGQGSEGLDLRSFRELYSKDAFYSWFGLDNVLIYSAHKAAGGITSIYRQIGLGSEELIRRILQDELGLNEEQATWSYQLEISNGRKRTLKLDGRIVPAYILDEAKRSSVLYWMKRAGQQLSLATNIANAMEGIVLEVRQGYKSKDFQTPKCRYGKCCSGLYSRLLAGFDCNVRSN